MTKEKSPLKSALCELKKLNIKITKETSNTFFKSKYADLATVLDAIESKAAEFGIIIISTIRRYEGGLELYTKICHKDSDELEESIFPVFGSKPQEIGSSVTYARRYNTQSLLNLAAEDDDGNSANEAPLVKTPVAPLAFKSPKERTALYSEVMLDLNNTKSLDDLQVAWLSRTEHLNALKSSDAQIFLELEKRKNEIKTQFQQMESK